MSQDVCPVHFCVRFWTKYTKNNVLSFLYVIYAICCCIFCIYFYVCYCLCCRQLFITEYTEQAILNTDSHGVFRLQAPNSLEMFSVRSNTSALRSGVKCVYKPIYIGLVVYGNVDPLIHRVRKNAPFPEYIKITSLNTTHFSKFFHCYNGKFYKAINH